MNPASSPVRKRILFVAEAVTLAHLGRPLSLAESLDPEKYEVHFACDPRVEHLLPETLIRHSLQSIPSDDFLKSLAKGRRLYSFATLLRYTEAELELLDAIKPDLIIGDMRLSLAVSCTHLKLPYACISNAHWSPYARSVFPMPALPFIALFGIALSQRLFNLGRPLAFRSQARPFNQLRKHYNQSPVADIRYSYTLADYTLYADIPELIPTYGLPANHHYLGFLNWSPSVSKPSWWDQLPDEQANVYLTLGSSGDINGISTIIDGLSQLPVNLLIASAGRIPDTTLARDNIFSANYLPGLEAAQRSALVICNGGSGTVYQALAEGVPVLGIPSNMDQHLTMGYVETAGAGLFCRSDRLCQLDIQQKAQQLVSQERYHLAAKLLKKQASKYQASTRFADFLQNQGF